jgi:DNA-binding NarL/FixJ family response regulator
MTGPNQPGTENDMTMTHASEHALPVTPSSTINIVIVEDHSMVASALAATLDAEDGFRVLTTVAQPADVRSVLAGLDAVVHVVLLDLRLGDGIDATDLIPTVRAACPEAKVVILSAWSDDRSIARVIEAGCDGYLLKDQHVGELIDAVRTVMADQPVFAPAIMKRVVGLLSPGRVTHNTLSARELDVLQRLGDGASTAEIASSLYVSENTVRNHVQSIMQKLGVHSRLEAVAHAVRTGLITVR